MHWPRFFGFIFFMPIAASCSSIPYYVTAANYGQHGVILINVPAVSIRQGHEGERVPIKLRIDPGIRGVKDDRKMLGRFADNLDSLPEQVQIQWQLAELSNCGYKFENRLLNCTWNPLPKIYKKTVDTASLRASEAFKKAGTSYESVALSKYTLYISLEFEGANLNVRTFNGHTNPWQ